MYSPCRHFSTKDEMTVKAEVKASSSLPKSQISLMHDLLIDEAFRAFAMIKDVSLNVFQNTNFLLLYKMQTLT